MTQLIDKDKIVAEIDKAIDEPAPSHDQQCPWEDGYYCGLYKAESIIDTLEVKENDLVEELDYDDYMTFFEEHPEYNNGDWGYEETWTFGQYCYKLGLKAQKEERVMTKRENNIYETAREYSNNRDNRMSFICGARWADNHPNAIDMHYLQNWYQDSIDETKEPIWTDQHLEELFNDFYLIPKSK